MAARHPRLVDAHIAHHIHSGRASTPNLHATLTHGPVMGQAGIDLYGHGSSTSVAMDAGH
jgi:hypothetical protein